MFNLNDYLKGLNRRKKSDDIPGTIEEYLEEECPSCKEKLRKFKPCCGSPNGYKGCKCGYKVII